MKRMLVAIDFSDVTEDVVQVTIELAQAFKGEVWLIHVEEPEPDFVGYEPGPQYVRDTVAATIRLHGRELHEIRDRLAAEGIEAKSFVIQGITVEKILTEARRLETDLIVLGTHEHGLFHHLLLGSVRDSLIAHSHCPVLVVPVRKA
ncbi:MAG TPA: universal stress protein [Candidatus Sumerlaeota bacterium]|nr:universal stress protein [Candidatus Sumerlaeota bacterium]HPS02524.1 universal stress protein [Candidatus Sumerlaeota bacterium]